MANNALILTDNLIAVQDEGVGVGSASTLNFVGTGVTAAVSSGTATITITGGGSGTPGGLNTQVQYNAAGTFAGISNVTSDGTNLIFTSGARIRGDFSNATTASRTLFQTSTTNGNTSIGLIPNGTGNTSQVLVFNNSDVTNASLAAFYINGTTNTILTSTRNGTGTVLPLSMVTGGQEHLRFPGSPSSPLVNYLTVSGSLTNNYVAVSVDGSDSNVGLSIRSKGTSRVALGQNGIDVTGSSTFNANTNANDNTTVMALQNGTGNSSTLWVVPRLAGGYNPISQTGEFGFFFTGNPLTSPGTPSGGLIIAPHSNTSSGLRMASTGDVTFVNKVGIGLPSIIQTPADPLEVATATSGARMSLTDGGGTNRKALLLQGPPTVSTGYARIVSHDYQTGEGRDLMFNDVNGGSLIIGGSALTTTATKGFLYLRTMPGVPTGVPTAYTGCMPITINSATNTLYGYTGSAWVSLTGSGGSGSPGGSSGQIQYNSSGTFAGASITTNGTNLIFTSGARIQGDFSNATLSSRTMIQSSTANGYSAVYAIPNGTATDAYLATANSSSPDLSTICYIGVTSTEAVLKTGPVGAATPLPLRIYNGTNAAFEVDTSSNVNFLGTSRRIRGDFSNATLADRTAFQSSVTNGGTGIMVLPNGTSQLSQLLLYATSTPTNSPCLVLSSNGTNSIVNSTFAGTGAILPLIFQTSGKTHLSMPGYPGSGSVPNLVNFLTISGSITANNVAIGVDGTDTNAGITLTPKGTGNVTVVSSSGWVIKSSTGSLGFSLMDRSTTPGRQFVFQGNDTTANSCVVNVAQAGGTTASPKTGAFALWSVDIANSANATQLQLANNATYGPAIFTQAFGTGTNLPIALQSVWDQATTPKQMYLSTGGKVGINTTAPSGQLTVCKQGALSSLPSVTDSENVLHLGGADNNVARVTIDTFNNSTTSGSTISFRRTRGTNSFNNTAVVANDGLGFLGFIGNTGVGYSGTTAAISVFATENWSTTMNGTAIAFETTTNGTTTRTERFRITSAGAISLGSSGTNTGTSGQVLTSQGSSSPPTWTTVSSGTPGGSNTQIQYNNSGAFAGASITTDGTSLTLSTGAKILGNFSDVTVLTDKTAFQSSITNSNTVVPAYPSGTGTTGGFHAFNGSDPSNSQAIGIYAIPGVMVLSSGRGSTSVSYVPLAFHTNGSEQLRILTTGAISLGSSGTNTGTSGQVLTSQGSGSPPTWTTVSGGGTPGGSSTQIQYNSSGTFAGNAAYWFDATNITQYVGPSTSPFGLTNGRLVLTVNSVADTANTLVAGFAYGQSATINLARGNNTLASPTAVTNNDTLGRIVTAGYDGTSLVNNASINFTVDGTVSTGSVPSKIEFVTTTGASANRKTQLTVDNAGNLVFNQTGQRIRGDLTSATHASRVLFQTNTVNGDSYVGVIPNGTSTSTALIAYQSSNPDQSPMAAVGVNASGGYIAVARSGTAATLPLNFYTNNLIQLVLDTSGNLVFNQTGQRIRGDFSNATQASRTLFQTSTTNGITNVGAIPNGTATAAVFSTFASADASNSSVAQVAIDSTAGTAKFTSTKTGTGTYLPLGLYTSDVEQVRINTNGIVDTKTVTNVKTAPTPSAGSVTLDVSTGSVFELTLTANLTSISFSNVPASGKATTLTVALKQDSTGGWTVTWPASVKWPNGVTPTLVTTASTTHIFQLLTYDGGTTYYGKDIGGGY